jgi:hypothetical protein
MFAQKRKDIGVSPKKERQGSRQKEWGGGGKKKKVFVLARRQKRKILPDYAGFLSSDPRGEWWKFNAGGYFGGK